MATRLWLQDVTFTSDQTPPGSLSSDVDLPLMTAPGIARGSVNTSTVTGPTSGVQVSATARSWWYRVNAVTISGTITKNLWGAESNMSANVGFQVIVDRCDGSGTFVSTVHNSEKGTELPVTTPAVQNWNTGSVTSTNFADGDHIRVRIYGNDGGGTMATGHTWSTVTADPDDGVNGYSWIEFTETITAYSATPKSLALPSKHRSRIIR